MLNLLKTLLPKSKIIKIVIKIKQLKIKINPILYRSQRD